MKSDLNVKVTTRALALYPNFRFLQAKKRGMTSLEIEDDLQQTTHFPLSSTTLLAQYTETSAIGKSAEEEAIFIITPHFLHTRKVNS